MASDDPHENPGVQPQENKPIEVSATNSVTVTPATSESPGASTSTPSSTQAAVPTGQPVGDTVAQSAPAPSATATGSASTNPAAAPPPAKKDESITDKIVLGVIDTVIIGGLISLLGVYYSSLKKFEDVKWTQDNVLCGAANCQIGKKNFHIYRFGEQPLKDVKVYFTVLDPNYEITGSAITQHEASALDFVRSPTKHPATGVRMTPRSSDGLNDANSLAFNFSELTADWIYEVSVDVKNKRNEPIQKFGTFQIRNAEGQKLDHEGLIFKDRLRLYSVEISIVAIVVVAVIGLFVWRIGNRVIAWRRT